MFRTLALALLLPLLLAQLPGCASFTLSDINAGAQAGRSFDTPFSTGKTTYQLSLTGHWTRDRK